VLSSAAFQNAILMALREKFGKLVLLEETGAGALGREYRAARLGPAGLDRLVTVLRFGPEVSSNAEATKRLMDEARLAARLHSPGLVRVLGIGRVEQSVYVSTELVEGRSVEAILDRCRGEAFPFAADHALMIASRAAAALEFLHGKKGDAGAYLSHGLIAPSRLAVAFDGEVKVKGLGLWPALRGTDLLPAAERRYLAPEQAKGEAGEIRSDVYALGLVLLEALTGQAPDGDDPLAGLPAARITSTTGEQGPLPKPLAELLRRALGREPAERFSGMGDLRKAIDALLFSGDFTPTTFDLAFFMHTLFREDMEREARALEDARRGDYGEFVAEEKPAIPASPETEPDSAPARLPPTATTARQDRPEEATTEVPAPTLAESARPTASDRPPPAAGLGPDGSGSRTVAPRASREAAAREAASRMTLGVRTTAPGGRRGLWLILGLLGAVVAGGGAGWFYFVKLRTPTLPSPAPLASAAQEHVRELEERIAQLEREKAEAESRAAEDARAKVEAQAATRGKTADPAAVAQAQEEARRRARADQEARQQEELRRIADEKTAEEQRAAAQPSPVPTPTPAATATPTPVPAAPPAPEVTPASAPAPSSEAPGAAAPAGGAAAVAPGPSPGRTVADPSDPAVRPPVLQSEEKVPYPPRAVSMRIATTVVVKALVDEQGRVGEATVVQPSGQSPDLGFDEAALKRVRSRRYHPARRHDVPVAIWVLVRIDFRPPPPRF
jgi:TonB family protein